MRSRLAMVAVVVVASVVALAASSATATRSAPRPLEMRSRVDSGRVSVVFDGAEVLSYRARQLDPHTVLVDLGHSPSTAVVNRIPTSGSGLIASVALEAGVQRAEPGTRVRLGLRESLKPVARRVGGLVVLDFEPAARATSPAPQSDEDAAAASLRASLRVRLGWNEPSGAVARTNPPATAALVAAPNETTATELSELTTSETPEGVLVTLKGNGTLTASRIQLLDAAPHRLLLDFANVSPSVAPLTLVHRAPVQRVRVARNSVKPLVTRVVLDLDRSVSHRLVESGDPSSLTVLVRRAGQTPDAPLERAVLPADHVVAAAATPAAAVADTKADATPATAVAPARAGAGSASAPRAGVPPVDVATSTPAMSAPPPATVAANTTSPVTTTAVTASGTTPALALALEPSAPLVAAQPSGMSAAVDPGTLKLAAPLDLSQDPMTQGPKAPASGVGETTILQEGRKQYSGHPVSLDFQGADLRSVLRTFAEITGLNLVIDPGVQGNVDVALRDVPWDQALDIILRANQLGYTVDGTIVRIAPLSALASEEKERRKLAEEQALSGELRVLTRSLSYARAADLAVLITRSALSQRGSVQVDERTNTLIIRDLQARLDTATELLGTLDRPQPQVEIEARIVQTSRDFARAIGVQWGFNGRMSPELGNTSPFAFPSRGAVGGRQGQTQGPTDPGTTAAELSSSAVNLRAPNATSAVGIALGAVNGAFNLDVALSALERNGKGRVLSTPRVSTQNNISAEVMQGIQIPIQTVANNTITVTFKDAALSLKVTPQITASQTVIMKIELENATPDFSRQVNGIPPIDTQRAYTQVLVNDGATTVIGGIFVSREQSVADRTPILHRLPLLGWLFKRDSVDEENRELLIFITPRILS